ncbi:MAG: ATP-binding protein [Ruminococcaceae bacterium]|nr:ATP-binding protein [Oscillospiraceae bacterium]
MLCQFTFKNFKSFRNEATLDLCAENIGEHSETLLVDEYDGEKFLPVVSIYGPNGGGKTSVLEAFAYIRKKICFPVMATLLDSDYNRELLDINDILKINEEQKYFKFSSECAEQPTEFVIICRIGEYEYNYQLSLKGECVVDECFYRTHIIDDEPEIIFERNVTNDGNQIINSPNEDLEGLALNKVRSDLTLLSLIAIISDTKIIDEFVHWLMDCKLLNYDKPFLDSAVDFDTISKNKKSIIELLNSMGIDIDDMREEKDSDGKHRQIYTTRINSDNIKVELNFNDESSGTRKVLSLLPLVYTSLYEGSVFIADEMDAKLHPKLFGYIISLFTDPKINKNQAQLICTSHDLYNMNKERFRRDEIWFCSMNAKNESTLYSLVQFKMPNGTKPRNDGSYSKQYIEGKFGADPYIRKGLEWEDINE